MKFSFKKITSVLACTALLGSTLGFAAAYTYPEPFVMNGAGDVAIVVSANEMADDSVAAATIGADLSGKITTGNNVGIPEGSALIDGPTKLIIGNYLTNVSAVSLDKSDMPQLLADGKFQPKGGSEVTVKQEIKLGRNLQFTHFADSEYKDRQPTLGIKANRLSNMMNYTVTFSPSVETTVDSDGRLADLQDKDMMLLGKTYTLLNAYNSTNSLELMGGAVSDKLGLGETKTYTIEGKTFEVVVDYVGLGGSSSNVREATMTVNGEGTGTMNAGSTFKLKDGTQLGIRAIRYQNFASGVMNVEFTLGAEKLTLTNGQAVKINDKTVYDLKAYIDKSAGVSPKQKINSIVIEWNPDTSKFVTESDSVSIPALGGIGLALKEIVMPAKEDTMLSGSSQIIQLSIPVKSGTAKLDLLGGNKTDFNNIGALTTDNKNLVTAYGAASTILFNKTKDYAFVATYLDGTTGESYQLEATEIVKEDDGNYTTIKDRITGNVAGSCDKIKEGSSCKVTSSLVLTINTVNPDTNVVNLTGASNVYFDRVVSKEGLLVYLPFDCRAADCIGKPGAINLTANRANPTWGFSAKEENKDSQIGAGKDINATVGWSSDKAEVKSVTDTGFAGGSSMLSIPGTSTTYVDYIKSDLGTKLTYADTSSQDSLEIEYHGGQTYAKAYVINSALAATVSGGNTLVITDAEAATSGAGKNLIVVGGTCINTVAADLLRVGALCGADFQRETTVGAGSFLIQTFERSNGKHATLVAGYESADTINAAKALTQKTVEIAPGVKYTGTSAETLVKA